MVTRTRLNTAVVLSVALLFASGCSSTAPALAEKPETSETAPAEGATKELIDVQLPEVEESAGASGMLPFEQSPDSELPDSIGEYKLVGGPDSLGLTCTNGLKNYKDWRAKYNTGKAIYANEIGLEYLRTLEYCDTVDVIQIDGSVYPGLVAVAFIEGEEEQGRDEIPECKISEDTVACFKHLGFGFLMITRAVREDDPDTQTVFLSQFLNTSLNNNKQLDSIYLTDERYQG